MPRLERPVADSPHVRGGVIVDPDGHRWMISRDVPAARPGDVVYAALWAPDGARTVAFYGHGLDWTVAGGHVPSRGLGTASVDRSLTLMCCYRVPDVATTVELVRAAGGTADDPSNEPYGRVAQCATTRASRSR